MPMLIDASSVREYIFLNDPSKDATKTSKYTDATIGSNIRAAQSFLEAATHRFLVDRTFDVTPWSRTTMLAAQVSIPGFRSFTQVTWGGSTLQVNLPGQDGGACWAIPDPLHSGQYVAMQFRAWRADTANWFLADRGWFDKGLDSPFYPGNRGGGYAFTSMPNDLCIYGSAGFEPGEEPEFLLHAVKVLAAFYTLRPASILADVALSPQGAVLNYSQLPAEAAKFIAEWTIGDQAISVG